MWKEPILPRALSDLKLDSTMLALYHVSCMFLSKLQWGIDLMLILKIDIESIHYLCWMREVTLVWGLQRFRPGDFLRPLEKGDCKNEKEKKATDTLKIKRQFKRACSMTYLNLSDLLQESGILLLASACIRPPFCRFRRRYFWLPSLEILYTHCSFPGLKRKPQPVMWGNLKA